MSAPGGPPSPARIMALSTAYWGSRCLLTAVRLDLFAILAESPLAADAVARRLGTEPRATLLFLRACQGLGLLDEVDGVFQPSAAAAAFLVPGGPAYLGEAIRYADDMWSAWTALETTLHTGMPAVSPEAYTGKDAERTRHFVRGMHRRALGIGFALVSLVDLEGRRRLLDVGGGPGTYAALFVKATPGLRAVVLDLPAVVGFAPEILDELDVTDRVELLPGDYHETAFPADCDAVLMSGIFHRESEASCRRLIARALDVLEPGGMLVVADVFTDPNGADPELASLFGVNMLLSAPDGGVHADADVARWMESAGLREVRRAAFPPPMPHRVVTGRR